MVDPNEVVIGVNGDFRTNQSTSRRLTAFLKAAGTGRRPPKIFPGEGEAIAGTSHEGCGDAGAAEKAL